MADTCDGSAFDEATENRDLVTSETTTFMNGDLPRRQQVWGYENASSTVASDIREMRAHEAPLLRTLRDIRSFLPAIG
jgi:hypothetical protein